MALTVPSVLAAGHVLEEFDCGKASFYDWLVRHARQSQSCGPAKTYVVADEQRVVGYFSLTVGQIDTLEAPDRVRKGMGAYPVPVVILARLAVDQHMHGAVLAWGFCRKQSGARSSSPSKLACGPC
ncbi:hypothetical protein [Klebsiella michiganensis]|uniref:hypothetical protein n=1 Tax=Klebsiella michiganensis TaxID=1134687 RepID=UPI001C78C379|nr:Acetyltransferase [Klebsiella sp. PL-2018]